MNKNILQLDDSLNDFFQYGIEALDKSREITQNVASSKSSIKDDGSLLTEYDLKVEKEIYNILTNSDADIITEEVLERKNNKEYCWYVDPIDGTTSFSKGIPLFGTIIGLTCKNVPIMGFIDIPKLGDRYFSIKDHGCYKNKIKVSASSCKKLSEAIISYGSPQRFEKEGMINQLHKIDSMVWDSRGYSDCFGYGLVFDSAIDLFIEVDLNPWETVALEILSIESGAGYAVQKSISGKKNIIFGSKFLVEDTTKIFGEDWEIK